MRHNTLKVNKIHRKRYCMYICIKITKHFRVYKISSVNITIPQSFYLWHYRHNNQFSRSEDNSWTLVIRLAPLFGGPLGLANFGWCKLIFGCNSSWKNSSVSSPPPVISSYTIKTHLKNILIRYLNTEERHHCTLLLYTRRKIRN